MQIQTLVTLGAGAFCAIVVGAGTAGVVMHTNANTVVHTAAFESNCPVEDVRVMSRHEGLGAGWYQLDICGAATRYLRTKTAFHRPGQHPDSVPPALPAPRTVAQEPLPDEVQALLPCS